MANVIATTSTSTASSSNWAAVDSTSELDSVTGTSTTSSSNQDSSTFTPGAITVDAVALNIASVANNGTGTFTVTLRDSTASSNVDSVTVNIGDLPYCGFDNGDEQCWVLFKFGSSHTLTAGHAYLIRLASSSTTVRLWRDGTSNNWSRKLRTTTTQALSAQNHFLVCNELTGAGTSNAVTVTWDLTSLLSLGPSSVGASAGSISGGGTVTWGVTASTNYFMQWRGVLWVTGGGTMNNGTSGSRVPSTTTHTLKMDCAANNDSKLRVGTTGNWKAYGPTKTPFTRLTVDAASSSNSFTCVDTTGWLASDQIVLSPTGSSRTQYERLTLNTIPSSTTFTTTGNSTNAHSGTSPIQAYVLNMTRNIKVLSGSTTNKGNVYMPPMGNSALNTGGITLEYVELDPSTLGSNSQNNRCFEFGPSFSSSGAFSAKYLSFNPSTSGAGTSIYLMVFVSNNQNTDHVTIDHCVAYDWAGTFIYCSRGGGSYSPVDINITSNVMMKQSDGTGAYNLSFYFPASGVNFNNNVCISPTGGAYGYICQFLNNSTLKQGVPAASFDGNECWYSDAYGFQFSVANGFILQTQNCKTIRNALSGWNFAAASGSYRLVSMKNLVSFGNATGNISHADLRFQVYYWPWKIILDGCTFAGDTTINSPQAIIDTANDYDTRCLIEMYNTTFGKSSGIQNAYITANIGTADSTFFRRCFEIFANNCYFGGSSYTGGGVHGVQGILDDFQRGAGDHVDRGASYLRCQDYNQTAGDHRTFAPQGTISIDTSVYHTASPAQKMTPNSASFKLRTGPVQCSVSSAVSRTVSVWVRRSKASSGDSADSNSAQPRLIVRRNDAVGISADTVVATGTVAIGNWEQLTGVALASPSENGAIELYVDCDGTTGFVSVDDWSIS